MYLGDFYRGRRVLVTGHTGFKGGWLSLWLREMGAQVLGYSLDPPTTPSLFEAVGLAGRVDSVFADVRDKDALVRVFTDFHPEVVFHLAAQAIVRKSYRDPYDTFDVNVLGTARVLEAALECTETRAVVVVTSDKCYENKEWEWGYRETDPMGGADPYSASKGCAEILASSYRRSFFGPRGKGLATARAGNVVGGGDFAEGRLLPDCFRAFSEGRLVRLRYPDSVRPWQHVLDPLAGYLRLGMKLHESPAAWSEGWNFGPDPESSRPVHEVVERFADIWGDDAHWIEEPGEHPPEASLLRLDSARARHRLGWQPAWALPTAIANTASWYRTFVVGGDVGDLCLRQIRSFEAASSTCSLVPREIR